MTRLLVVHHSPSPSVRSILEAVLEGTHHELIAGVEVVERSALEATVDDLLAADAILLGTTANFGYLSGALKHFFDTTYYGAREATAGRPFSFWIHGGYDTTGAERAMTSITTGFGWSLAAEPLVFTGAVDEEHLERARELGATVAATIAVDTDAAAPAPSAAGADGMLVGLETGGTKTLCALAHPDDPGTVVARHRIPTTTPDATLAAADAWLREMLDGRAVAGAGIAAFGPIDLDPRSPDFTRITETPKPGWSGASLLEGLPVLADAPVCAVTDVTGAAIGERAAGALLGLARAAYVTVGTGIGAGVILDGVPIVGTGFIELGHLMPRRHPGDDFAGQCPHHGDCLEGLACGPAIEARFGLRAERLDGRERERAAALIGDYVAQLAWVLRLGYGAQRVVLGGGVMQVPGALESARTRLDSIAGVPLTAPDGAEFLTRPGLGDDAGLHGALEIAAQAAARP